MWLRYTLFVKYDGACIYQKSFKSINNVVIVAAGFNYDSDSYIYMHIIDDLTDRIISFNTLKKMIKELCYD